MPLIKKQDIHLGSQPVHMWRNTEGGAVDIVVAPPPAAPVPDQDYAEAAAPQNEFVIDPEEYERRMQDIVAQGNQQAGEIKNAAEAEARRIIDEAQKKAQEILEAEQAKGVEQGKKEIYEQLKSQLQEAQSVIKQANAQKNSIIKSAVPEILKLATRIAGQVIRNELTQNQSIVMDIVKDAIEKISDNEQVVIKVSAQDLQAVRNEKELIIDLVEAKNLSIVPDKHLAEGGCLIETKLGFIDAKVVTKLEMIQSALLAVYNEDKVKRETVLKEKVERGEEIDVAAEEQKEIAELMQETTLDEIREQEKKMLEDQMEAAGAAGGAEANPLAGL
jgi:flagellar assembly protein FliH